MIYYYVSDGNLSFVCGPSCISHLPYPIIVFGAVIEMRIQHRWPHIAEAAAVATNLRLIPYIHNYNIYHLYEYGCKHVSRRWLKYKTRVYVCVCIYTYLLYIGEKSVFILLLRDACRSGSSCDTCGDEWYIYVWKMLSHSKTKTVWII